MSEKPNGMTPRIIPIGQGLLTVTSDDFINGYQAGHLAYMVEHRASVLTDDTLRTLILEKLESLDYPELYSVGFTVGLIVALACKPPTPTLPRTQEGKPA